MNKNQHQTFIHDRITKKSHINPILTNGLKEFASLKNLVFHCADLNHQVDTNLLKGLIDSVDLRCKMIAIEIKADDLEVDGDENDIYSNALKELVLTEPMSVKQKIADHSELVGNLSDRLIETISLIETFKSEIIDRTSKVQKKIDLLLEAKINNFEC